MGCAGTAEDDDRFIEMETGMDLTRDEQMMQLALAEAKKAASLGETPIGAVLTWDGEVLTTAHNLRETGKMATAHAELLAIEEACRKLGGWRLHRAVLYVTLEPCPMCAGAIINARIPRVVYAAADKKAGCCGGLIDLFAAPFNHIPQVTAGVLKEEAQQLLTDFFTQLRQKPRPRRKLQDFMPKQKPENYGV